MSVFRRLYLDPLATWPTEVIPRNFIERLNAEHGCVDTSLYGARDLAEWALDCFRGMLPFRTFSAADDEMVPLPWCDRYWFLDDSTDEWFPCALPVDEIETLAEKLRRVAIDENLAHDDVAGTFWGASTCFENASPMLEVQLLSTEVLLEVDEFIERLVTGQVEESLRWLAAANRSGVDLLLASQRLVSDLSANARVAARKRHQTSPKYAAKQLVLECWKGWMTNRTRYSNAKPTRFKTRSMGRFQNTIRPSGYCRYLFRTIRSLT